MGQAFYILQGGTQAGPYDPAEIASMGIGGDVMVWAEGMSEWRPANRVPALAAAIQQAAWSTQEVAQEPAVTEFASSPQAVSYQSSHPRAAPSYSAIVSGATVLRIVGYFFIGIGALAIVIVLFAMIRAVDRDTVGIAMFGGAISLIGPLFLIAFGILFLFVASIGLAIRDIARNSFR